MRTLAHSRTHAGRRGCRAQRDPHVTRARSHTRLTCGYNGSRDERHRHRSRTARTVNPEGHQTQYAFQSGPTAGYGHETPLSSAGAGSSASAISATPSGLAPAARITSGRSRSMLRAQRLSAPIGASAQGARLPRRRRRRSRSPAAPSSCTHRRSSPPPRSTRKARRRRTTSSRYDLSVWASNPAGECRLRNGERRGPPPSAGAAREHDLSLRVVAQTAGATTYGADRAVRTTGSSHIPVPARGTRPDGIRVERRMDRRRARLLRRRHPLHRAFLPHPWTHARGAAQLLCRAS